MDMIVVAVVMILVLALWLVRLPSMIYANMRPLAALVLLSLGGPVAVYLYDHHVGPTWLQAVLLGMGGPILSGILLAGLTGIVKYSRLIYFGLTDSPPTMYISKRAMFDFLVMEGWALMAIIGSAVAFCVVELSLVRRGDQPWQYMISSVFSVGAATGLLLWQRHNMRSFDEDRNTRRKRRNAPEAP